MDKPPRWKDPIVEEVRAIREAYAKRFGHDLKKIGADLIKKQEARQKALAKAQAKGKRPAKPTAPRKAASPKGRKAA
ncbi:MAG TPA: hypothetical protein PKE29_12300 [Phycisphaerales bacterium]|nr:hypothetical protein [Phycisphaerales bacterium]